ncbi:hypothetical protein ACWDEN_47225, partial [Streptomyces sp. NPDC001153]
PQPPPPHPAARPPPPPRARARRAAAGPRGPTTALRRLVEPVRASFRYDDGTPELLLARMRHWNRLQSIADRWGDADGYDRDRWSCLFRLDAADEELSAEYARRREAEQAACERDRLLRIL